MGRRSGIALIITHPDYLIEPRVFESYKAFLAAFKDDPDMWHALPRDVNAWWRRRAASSLVETGDGWEITGPGKEEASIEFAGPVSIAK